MIKSKSVSSNDNSDFKLFKSLTESKGLKKEKLFLVSGQKLVAEFIKKNPASIAAIIFDEKNHQGNERNLNTNNGYQNEINQNTNNDDQSELNNLLQNLSSDQQTQITRYQFATLLFKQIDVLGTHSPILVAKQKPILSWNPEAKFTGLEVLCPLSDPQNLGSLARSAWALGADRIVLLKEAAHPYLPKTWKASAGTIWDIPLYAGPSLHELTSAVIALDMEGEKLWNFKWPRCSRLLLGEEGQGIPIDLAPIKISIPMRAGVESLNVAVAGALAINHYYLNKVF